jgi:hypothetical protein
VVFVTRTTWLIGQSLYALFEVFWLVTSARKGDAFGVAFVLLMCSTIPMGLVGTLAEHRTLGDLYGPGHASWAFVFGDAIFLPFAGVMFTLAWGRLRFSNELAQGWWIATSAIIGITAGLIFHAMDGKTYDAARLNSPTKLVHDFVAYPLFFGGLVFVGLPAFVLAIRLHQHTALTLVIIGLVLGVGGWAACGLHDAKLDPKKLHIAWNWSQHAHTSP